MRILVTGGSGFLGSNLVPELSKIAEVWNFDPMPPRNPTTAQHWRQASVLDQNALADAFRQLKPTHLVHLGARTDLMGRNVEAYAANTTGVSNVIDQAAQYGALEHVIYASSRLVFAIDHKPSHDFDYRPSTPYGESKIVGETLVRTQGSTASNWTIVRPTSIWGPWFDAPYRDFFDMVAKGRYVKIRGHDPLKSFGYVGNAVHEIIQVLKAPSKATHEKVLWLMDYEPLLLSNWAQMVAENLGRPAPREVGWPTIRAAAIAGDLLSRAGVPRFPLTSFRLNNLVTDMVYDAAATEQIVGPLPYSLREGVEETCRWYLARDQS